MAFCALAGSAIAQQPAEPAQPAYDPAPFLASMVTMRTVAVTCDRFVANSPTARTQSIVDFFKALNQELPDLTDGTTQKSLDRFVRSQAAVLCRDKLEAAYRGYQAQAQVYLASKPDDWPAPPEVANGPWCSSENCLEF
jgi:hypothetical protein